MPGGILKMIHFYCLKSIIVLLQEKATVTPWNRHIFKEISHPKKENRRKRDLGSAECRSAVQQSAMESSKG
jgi:hypothetical protein